MRWINDIATVQISDRMDRQYHAALFPCCCQGKYAPDDQGFCCTSHQVRLAALLDDPGASHSPNTTLLNSFSKQETARKRSDEEDRHESI